MSNTDGVSFVHNVQDKYTLAYKVEPWNDRLKVEVGIAFCSPRDNFCRRIGRAVALGRMSHESDVNHKHTLYFSGKKPTRGEEWRMLEEAIKGEVGLTAYEYMQ